MPFLQIGDGGFYCVGCPKLFPQEHPTKPSHETEPSHETTPPHEMTPPYETEYRRRGYLTEADLRKLFAKRAKRRLSVRTGQDKRHCPTIGHYAPRGAGQLPVARIYSHFHAYRFHPDYESDHKPDHNPRSNTLGPLFDGSFGIDTEDLANIPDIDFSTVQYFPDQNSVGPDGEIDLTDHLKIAQSGIDWVNLHGETGKW
jgi:mannan endo-1,4-beta-mannosidase